MMKYLRAFWWVGAILVIVLFISSRFLAPPPPKSISFASGSETGAYTLTANAYAEVFADNKFTLNVVHTSGSGDNLELLRSGQVSAAIVQGGVSTPADQSEFQSLGAIFYEPFWVFYRSELALDAENLGDMRDLNGLRIAAGSANSGTRVLTEHLLGQNGISGTLLDIGGATGADALMAGDIDVLISVTSPRAPFVRSLLEAPQIDVLSFDRALAYERRQPFLKQVIFPEGGLDLSSNLPENPIEMIAPAAEVVVRSDLHPALQSLLLEAMNDIHKGGSLLAPPGTFPNPDRIDLPIAKEAARFYENGPSFMRRLFPFTLANFLERAWVLAIPLLTLGFPLVRAAPPIYRWRTRRKVYVWYKDLRELETQGRAATTQEQRKKISKELSRLQAEVGRVEVPESYTDELYRLRSHILFVNQLIRGLDDQNAMSKPISSD